MKYESNYLSHHGIKGQVWGKRNGPPYPLKASAHSAKERKYQGSNYDDRMIKKYTKQIDNRKKDDSVKNALKLVAEIPLDILTLNPVSAALNIYQVGGAVSASFKERSTAKRLAKEKIEEKTGLHLKDDNNQTREEDAKLVNPGYRNLSTLTKRNCVLCTNTYELRRRGYDVVAEGDKIGYGPSDLKRWFPKAKVKNVAGIDVLSDTTLSPEKMLDEEKRIRKELRTKSNDKTSNNLKSSFGMNKALSDATIKALEKEPNGSRGNMFITWGMGGGHSVAYEIVNHKLVIIDSQSGKVYNNPEKILKSGIAVKYARLDNVPFNVKTIKECCK